MLLLSHSMGDFTLGVIPDAQNLTVSSNSQGAQRYRGMTQFFVDHKNDLNVVFVASLGDMTQSYGSSQSEWPIARAAFDVFETADIPYAPCQGNHDDLSFLNQTFPVSDFIGTPTWGDYLRGIENAYYLFSAEGMDFILVVIQDHSQYSNHDATSIQWANDVFRAHPDHRGILVTHDMVRNTEVVAQVLSQNENVFLGVCGHVAEGSVSYSVQSPSGKTINYFLSDYQADADGGASVRYYTFKPALNQVCAKTYNIPTQSYVSDQASEFCFDYDMVAPVTPQIRDLTHTPVFPGPTQDVAISARITDNVALSSANLKWGTTSGNLVNEIAMTAQGDVYSAVIPAQALGTTVYYRVFASDGDGNTDSTAEAGYVITQLIAAWNSWDIQLGGSGSPKQATVSDGAVEADILFYESTDNNGFAQGGLFSTAGTTHAEAFNDLSGYWYVGAAYPYAGKNKTARAAGEAAPQGVFDLQMHPPSNAHSVVTAFVAPLDGMYKVSGLGLRRLHSGGQAAVNLAGNDGVITASVSSSGNIWSFDEAVHDLGRLSAGDIIHFGVTNVDGYAMDATEVAWTIQLFDADTSSTSVISARTEPLRMHYEHTSHKVIFRNLDNVRGIILTDINGSRIPLGSAFDGRELDMSGFSKGVYFIRARNNIGSTFGGKIIRY